MDIYGNLIVHKGDNSMSFNDLNFVEDAEKIRVIVSLSWENGYKCEFAFSEVVSKVLN